MNESLVDPYAGHAQGIPKLKGPTSKAGARIAEGGTVEGMGV